MRQFAAEDDPVGGTTRATTWRPSSSPSAGAPGPARTTPTGDLVVEVVEQYGPTVVMYERPPEGPAS